MLTGIEFREYCDRLGFPASTVELIQKIRTSPPSRRVASDVDNVSGIYPSEKNGFGVQFESHTSEFPFIYKLESNPNVLEYYCQPPPILLDYECASGKRLVVWHTPDFFVLRSDQAGWVEAKPENKLLVLANKMSNRYQLVAEKWVCPPVSLATWLGPLAAVCFGPPRGTWRLGVLGSAGA